MSSPNYRSGFNNNIPSNIRSNLHGISGINWSPKVFGSALQLWCRSDQGITLETGVKQWDDLSGLGHHLIQLIPTKQPHYNIAQTANGRPLLTFDGYSSDMKLKSIRSFTLVQPYTLYISCVNKMNTAANGAIFDGYTSTGYMVSSQNQGAISIRALASISAGLPVILDVMHLIQSTWNTTNSSVTLNNRTPGTGNINNGAPNGVTIGGNSTVAGFGAKLDVSEIVIVNRVLTSSEAISLKSYMINWSGIIV